MNQLLNSTAERAIRYLESLPYRSVAPSSQAIQDLSRLKHPMPDESTPDDEVIAQLDELVSPATLGTAGPRFFGFVIGGSLPVTLAANWLAGAWDQNSALYNTTPGTATIEQIALDWLLDLFNLPKGSAGAFVTGATVANFTALAAARNRVLSDAGWNVEADGLFGAPPITVIIGAEAHPSVLKSLGMLGLGRSRQIKIPVDSQGRMRPDALPEIKGPTIVCLQAGNVNTGAFDPFDEIIDRLDGTGAWVHVDGAFGLWAAAAPSMSHLTRGLQRANSWATDAHKWLNVPYDSGLAFVRDCLALQSAMALTAEYLPTETKMRNPSDFTPELSRRARGVEIWAALMSLGRKGVADLVERDCRHARRFAEGLSAAGYQVLNEVVLNQALISFGETDKTKSVIDAIQTDGTCWCGGTQWQGHTAMRISVSSWATTEADVEMSLEAMIRAARSVEVAAGRQTLPM